MPMEPETNSCCRRPESPREHACGCTVASGAHRPWRAGTLTTPAGLVPQVADTLDIADRRGAIRVRLGLGRDRYRVEPGLYALGAPDANSPVLVTANYKLSFDHLRSALHGWSVWILVLDTAGINVWCAAAKGTFGTEELVRRIHSTGLPSVVEHRQLIVPQLGATGIAAHLVAKASGFSVVYGPVRAADLTAFLDAGCQATPDMRRVTFNLKERTLAIPTEVVMWGKWILPFTVVLAALRQFQLAGALLGAFLAGTVMVPLLLPWLPGKGFSLKGMFLGLFLGLPAAWATVGTTGAVAGGGLLLVTVSVTSFFALNFTGCSTFTSLSGTRYETLRAVPLQVLALLGGLAFWCWSMWS